MGEITAGAGPGALARLPADILATLTEPQRQALAKVLEASGATRPPVDIRLTVPFPLARYFLVVVAGRDRRTAARNRAESALRPLGTFGNLAFFLALTVLFCLAGLVGAFLWSGVLTL